MSVSVLILTLNEEANLPRCLESLAWTDDVVVLDSGSSDHTQELARKAGARVEFRAFDNYAAQRNYGLNEIEYKYPWILMVDADELVPDELAGEIRAAVSSCPDDVSMFRMRRKDFLMGKWLKHSSGYPTWFGRLIRGGCVRVERSINEEYCTDGKVISLEHHLHHYPFNKGLHAWFEKHNRYSTMEAELKFQAAPVGPGWRKLFSPDPVLRRKAQKELVYSLPGRPLIVFTAFYFLRGGLLEGRAGFMLSMLKAIYEYMIVCKTKELKRRKTGLPF
ncbi:MAG TPA: glycosyltransferase family 2 protein [Gammaproteobacteria bacterium]|nr:glycosyltransferase family 2 protein [Gammaproteobacteria bacterium]